MPGVGKAKTYSERLRMGVDCDEVYPGIIIGKEKKNFSKKESYKSWNLFFSFNLS
jgi:hypothetical protein